MAMDLEIQKQLERVGERERRLKLWTSLALCWCLGGALALGFWLLELQVGWKSALGLPVIGLLVLGGGGVIAVRNYRRTLNWHDVALNIESHHPELEGRLITAVQQRGGSSGELNYLQQLLIRQTLEYGQRTDWAEIVPPGRLRLAQAGHWIAAGLFVFALVGLGRTGGHQLLSKIITREVNVTPGDASLERGSSMVVLARFKGPLPPRVDLVYGQTSAVQRVTLVKSLGDPMFGGSVPEVDSNFVYHIEYAGQRTRDFNVTVYEHPRLERADVDVTFPAYTTLPHKRIENTHRLSAVEGSQVDLALQLNKPVASAKLVARDNDHTTVPLTVESGQPRANLKQFNLTTSQKFDLQLIDTEGRTNKVPAEFVFEALKNRTPEMRLTSPKGDIRPSPLEEISFEGTVWDDFGVKAFGVAYAVNGGSPSFIELGQSIAGNEKHGFKHLLRLETLHLKPDELLSWFVWADDLGPDGQVRRTMGDLYFGEVRPFEEVFREGQGMEGQGGEQMGGGDQTAKLTDLEKQIVNATWKLQRENSRGTGKSGGNSKGSSSPDQSSSTATPGKTPQWARATFNRFSSFAAQASSTDTAGDQSATKPKRPDARGKQAPKYEDDAGVVLESQARALDQAKQALEGQHDPQTAGLWQKAITEMESALARLQKATNSPAALQDALAAEQAAYQALIRLQAHEYQVSRSRNRNQNGSGREQQMQRQLEELDLSESENKYENQREAQRNQNPEQREQLQIMSRLQELARRQQDLNDRLKELQTALQEARTEEERAEIKRQLKRLQEEEQQMLADVDELRQRMERPENQSRLADEKRQLDQTRQEVQKAADAASQGAASQALAAGTRAQDQFQQLRDQIRKKNSSQFADDMRQLRSQARQLERQQEDILKKIQEAGSAERKSLSEGDNQEQTRAQLAQQKQLMTNLLDRASQVSQQAEEAEPLLSRQLYDSVRKFTQDTAKDQKDTENELLSRGPMTRGLLDVIRDNSQQGAPKMEDMTSELLKQGYLSQAGKIGERARTGIDNLRKGVERAAESVLGDDTEDLRLAQKQLDDLANQLQREIADNQGLSQTNSGAQNSASNNGQSQKGQQQGKQGQSSSAQQQASAQGSDGNKPQQGKQGQGQGQGQQQDPNSNNPGEADSTQTAQNQGSGKQPGQSGTEPGGTPSQQNGSQPADSPANGQGRGQRGLATQQQQNNAQGGAGAGGGDPTETAEVGGTGRGSRNFNWDRLLDENARRQSAPITGEDFPAWSDRLREVEELLDAPDLRDDVAKARERARLVRQDFKKERKKPDWAVVQLQVMKPLTEVRDRIGEELARRESREALVPLDRDPVPNRYSELVRRYYEELGKDK